MAANTRHSFLVLATFLVLSSLCSSATHVPTRKLALVQPEPLILKDHKGPLLKGNMTVNLIWYGKFTTIQRSTITNFIRSLSSKAPATSQPSVSSWWDITTRYRNAPTNIALGRQIYDVTYSLGKTLTPSQLVVLSSKTGHRNSINIVLTDAEVVPEHFCMNTCGAHGASFAGKHKKVKFAYGWVGNPAKQCPGECAWPFAQPMFGPQTPPLVAPNGDVGVDGMILNLATILAGTVTNPFDTGFFQGPADASLEAVSACAGLIGTGSFPGYPGKVLVDPKSKASYNAHGVRGSKYLLPAIWDPKTLACKTLV